ASPDLGVPLRPGPLARRAPCTHTAAGRHSDLVIAIGARFDDRSASSWMPGYSWNFPQSKLIHVDVDPAELGRNYLPDIGVLADARTFLRQLLAEIEKRNSKRDGLKARHTDIQQRQDEREKFIK